MSPWGIRFVLNLGFHTPLSNCHRPDGRGVRNLCPCWNEALNHFATRVSIIVQPSLGRLIMQRHGECDRLDIHAITVIANIFAIPSWG